MRCTAWAYLPVSVTACQCHWCLAEFFSSPASHNGRLIGHCHIYHIYHIKLIYIIYKYGSVRLTRLVFWYNDSLGFRHLENTGKKFMVWARLGPQTLFFVKIKHYLTRKVGLSLLYLLRDREVTNSIFVKFCQILSKLTNRTKCQHHVLFMPKFVKVDQPSKMSTSHFVYA